MTQPPISKQTALHDAVSHGTCQALRGVGHTQCAKNRVLGMQEPPLPWQDSQCSLSHPWKLRHGHKSLTWPIRPGLNEWCEDEVLSEPILWWGCHGEESDHWARVVLLQVGIVLYGSWPFWAALQICPCRLLGASETPVACH